MIVGYSLTRTRTVSLTIFTRVLIGTYSFFSVFITVCFIDSLSKLHVTLCYFNYQLFNSFLYF